MQGFFATASITFCDQASWQSRIAAKPTQGVLGFFAATYIWFAIPSTIGTSVGFAYLDHTAGGANQSLSNEAIDSGIVSQKDAIFLSSNNNYNCIRYTSNQRSY